MATGTNSIPERLINYRVYNESNALMGMATVDLPELQAMSDTVSGAGIAGEVDSPVLGHYRAMSSTFNWRTIERPARAGQTAGSSVGNPRFSAALRQHHGKNYDHSHSSCHESHPEELLFGFI